MTPFWDHNLTPLCGQLAAPYLHAHRELRLKLKLFTQIWVLGPASYPVGYRPCPGRASHAWE